jgi:hypothetical protein
MNNWPKLNPVNFDESKMTDSERAGLLDAYEELTRNPAFQLIVQDVRTSYEALGTVAYCIKYGIEMKQAVVMQGILAPILSVESAVAAVVAAKDEEDVYQESRFTNGG